MKKLIWLLACLICLAFFGAFLEVYLARRISHRAELLVTHLANMTIESATSESFEKAARESGLTVSRRTECVPGDCLVIDTIYIDNTHLSRWRLAPETSLTAELFLRGGRTDSLSVNYKVVYHTHRFGGVLIDLRESDPSGESFVLAPRYYDQHPGRAIVHLTSKSTALQRRETWDLNIACLRKIGGCASAADLAPGIWRLVKADPTLTPHP
jgi:hypothetical protein